MSGIRFSKGSQVIPPDVNIYNSNGTLTGARTVTMANNSLSILGGNTILRGSGTTSFTDALTVQNNTPTTLFQVRNDGSLVSRLGANQGAVRINAVSGGPLSSSIGIGTALTNATVGEESVTIGGNASGGSRTVSIGPGASANNSAISIGYQTNATAFNSIAIGAQSNANSAEFVAGSPSYLITNLYFGSGRTRNSGAGVGSSYTINGSGAFGTNFAGGNLTLAGGKNTGNAAQGDVIIATSAPGASGTTLAPIATRITFNNISQIFAEGYNIETGTVTGTIIGTSSSQRLSFWNQIPTTQPTSAIIGAAYVNNAGSNIQVNDTFDGYTVGQVVAALRSIGILA